MSSYNSSDYSSMSDEELVELYKAGNNEALDVLTLRFFNPCSVSNGAGYLDSEDLSQEGMFGFISAVRSYSFEKGVPFSAYAHICINNRINSAIRKIKNDLVTVDESELDSASDFSNDVIVAVEDDETLHNVLKHCETCLSDIEKSVVFCRMSGLTYDEIAEKLAVTPKTVDNALHRARNKLKEILS